jgi:hypothetical protein
MDADPAPRRSLPLGVLKLIGATALLVGLCLLPLALRHLL